jgi:hypothetical protein
MSVEEYAGLLEDFAIDTGCLPGRDTVFAWFGPEPSEFDRRMAERLVRRGVIDASFAAAVLAVDPGTPLFSDARAGLLAHVPDEVTAPDMASLPTAVRQAALDSLTAVPVAERSEAEVAFLAMLESSDAVGALGERVAALREGLQADLDPTDAPRRAATLERLYGQLVGNRKRFAQSPVSARLSEFPGLLPLPAED